VNSIQRFSAVALAVLAVAGCASPAPEPTTTAAAVPAPTPTPTPTPIDPTLLPVNRFGIDCGALLVPADLAPVYGAELPLGVPDRFDSLWDEPLIQDRALLCRWGGKNGIDYAAPSVTIIAAPYTRTALDAIVGSVTPVEGAPEVVSVGGVGDAAWVSCNGQAYGSVACLWTVAVGDSWVSVKFDSVGESEADVTSAGDFLTVTTPKSDSPGAALVARIAGEIKAATPQDAAPPAVSVSACDSIADWDGLSAEFGLGPVRVSGREYNGPPRVLGSVVTDALVSTAAGNQSAQWCMAVLGDGSSARETYVWVRVIPGGGWIGETGLWGGWGAEDCHGWEGGPVCELSGFANGRGAYVLVGGGLVEGLAGRVYEQLTN